jgi:hypothetical protein
MERLRARSPWRERLNLLVHRTQKSDPVSVDRVSRQEFGLIAEASAKEEIEIRGRDVPRKQVMA